MFSSKLIRIRALIYLGFCCLIVACNEEVKQEKEPVIVASGETRLAEFLQPQPWRLKELNSILVLNETGCLSCNKSFAQLIERQTNRPNTLIVVNALGVRMDISAFIGDSLSNVLIDEEQNFLETGLIEHSGVIFLNRGKIDTIVAVSAKNIEKQFAFIEGKLTSQSRLKR